MQDIGVDSSMEWSVVVSPHFDDAVFSLGGLFQGSVPRLRVVTLCAGEPGPSLLSSWDARSGFASGAEAARRRRNEDRAACRLLGVEALHLPFADFPYTGPKSVDAVIDALRGCLAGAARIWAPLGIGAHPDHLAARDAVLQLVLESSADLLLYADAPYASARGFFRPDGERDPDFQWAPAMKAISDAGFVLGAAHVEALSAMAFGRKVELASCYASQLPGLRHHYPRLTELDGPLAHECWWPCHRAAVERAS